MLHGFASKILNFSHPAAQELVRPEALHAPALQALPEAGRRGGESIAREVASFIFHLPKEIKII